MADRLAFVDLETTGTSAQRDRITEIGVVLVDETGVSEWSCLIHPGVRIPAYIEQLTGITNEMVVHAPVFETVAEELESLLEGRLFIAHNARFDYAFLKHAFARSGRPFKPRVLCTVKLSRQLYPDHHRHSLDSLIERHGLTVDGRHRALADARLIYQFWQIIQKGFDAEHVQDAIRRQLRHTSFPSGLDPHLAHELPEVCGVYLFYGENALPLYIGKSRNIRQRVLAHFAADHRSGKEMGLARQVRDIRWFETGGEIGALLMESRLIKEQLPVYNQRLRRKSALCSWQLTEPDPDGVLPRLVFEGQLDPGRQERLYGLYTGKREAEAALRQVAEEHHLCLSVLGLEKTGAGRPCFRYQIRQCRGACVGEESKLSHAMRLIQALSPLKLAHWPYPGAIAIVEGEDRHVIDRWCYLGTARNEGEMAALMKTGRPVFDRDTYRLLIRWMPEARIIMLG